MYRCYYDDVIDRGQLISKWHSDGERRALAEISLSVYYGQRKEYLETIINQVVSKADKPELKKYISSDDLTADIVNQISKIFSSGLTVNIANSDGSINEKYSKEVNRLLNDCDFFMKLQTLNKLTNVVLDLPVLAQRDENKVWIDILTPDNCFVTQNQQDPTISDEFYFLVGVTEDSPLKNNRVDIYHMYDSNGDKWKVEIDNLGNVNPDSKVKLKTDNYEKLPVIIFRNYIPINRFWFYGSNPLIKEDLNLTMRRTEAEMMMGYEIPQLYTKGLDKGREMTVGRSSVINLGESNGLYNLEIGYVKPEARIESIHTYIKDRIALSKRRYGFSESMITGDSASSGFHLMLSKSEIIEACRAERVYYEKPLKDLIKYICFLGRQVGYKIPKDIDISFKFGDLDVYETSMEKRERITYDVENGFMSIVEAVMEIRNIDRDKAEAAIEQIKKDKTKYGETELLPNDKEKEDLQSKTELSEL